MREPRLMAVAVVAGLIIAAAAVSIVVGVLALGDAAAMVQSVCVVLGVALAVSTLRGDRRDKQVDRVLDLHRELMSDDLQDARTRLQEHLRINSGEGHYRVFPFATVREIPSSERYISKSPDLPLYDAKLILRYFERINTVVASGAVDQPLFCQLLARHALWWNQALGPAPTYVPRVALQELAEQINRYLKPRSKLLEQVSFTDSFEVVAATNGHANPAVGTGQPVAKKKHSSADHP